MTAQTYLIALGSNQRHPRYGSPHEVLAAANLRLETLGLRVLGCSRIIDSAPLGPSRRRYANGAVLLETGLAPLALLRLLQGIEGEFGRVRRGRRWGARVLDLDVVLWQGGIFADPRLLVPHPRFRQRRFVLGPARTIAPGWRDPVTGLTLAQLHARLTRPRPVPR